MKNMDQALWNEWVDLDLDGELLGSERDQLQEALAARPELQRERRELKQLHHLLDDSKIEVHPQFEGRVMDALPVAAWQKAPAAGRFPAWALPVALVVVMAVASSLVFAGNLTGNHLVETGAMLADLVKTSALAGSGLLFATWRGVGIGVEELVADSTLNLAVFGVFVLCVNLLFLSFLRRRRPAAALAESARDSQD